MALVTLQLRQLDVPPGQRLLIHEVSWAEFENILEELGENRSSRIAYSENVLEIKIPLPKHEREKSLLGDMVKLFLDELGMDCECYGSTTFKRQSMSVGIEPDDCFYIQNHQAVMGRDRLDLSIDPPPDLVIEVDVTSKTQTDAYVRLGVPELWVFEGRDLQMSELKIYVLQAGQYESVVVSPTFLSLPVIELIAEGVAQSLSVGRSPALRGLRQRVREIIQTANS
jgi:Uma2 family endonuclease